MSAAVFEKQEPQRSDSEHTDCDAHRQQLSSDKKNMANKQKKQGGRASVQYKKKKAAAAGDLLKRNKASAARARRTQRARLQRTEMFDVQKTLNDVKALSRIRGGASAPAAAQPNPAMCTTKDFPERVHPRRSILYKECDISVGLFHKLCLAGVPPLTAYFIAKPHNMAALTTSLQAQNDVASHQALRLLYDD